MSTFFSKLFQPILQSPVYTAANKPSNDHLKTSQSSGDVPKNFYGKYKLATSENFEEFLREIGKFIFFIFLFSVSFFKKKQKKQLNFVMNSQEEKDKIFFFS